MGLMLYESGQNTSEDHWVITRADQAPRVTVMGECSLARRSRNGEREGGGALAAM
jgi:hypothetical protein